MGNEKAISVHFGEIALKGNNRSDFENALVDNIRNTLEGKMRIDRIESRIIVYPEGELDAALKTLANVFGIAWFAPIIISSTDIEEIKKIVVANTGRLLGKRIKVEASRSDKNYPMTSPEINREVGAMLEANGHSIDLNNPEAKIYIAILKERALISFERFQGLNGLPVGTSGNVLTLLSGGIDSPVAAYLMMKRGCIVDFLHVHSGKDAEEVKSSKIIRMIEGLKKFHPFKFRLFIAPYTEFYKKAISMDQKSELVVFRKFIIRLADRIAKENGSLGVVTGDNIGQVASQTLENLAAVNDATTLPIYRPVVSYDKQEIINLAKRIGTYDVYIEEYKDCCSLVAVKHPSTRVKVETAKKLEQEIGIDEIIEKTMMQVEMIEV